MSANKKILILCPYPVGVAAGQRLKYEQQFKLWKDHGFELTVSPFMDIAMWSIVYKRGNYSGKIFGLLRGYFRRAKDLCRLRKFDTIYVFLWVTPLGTSIIERIFKNFSKYLIYDIEDNIFDIKSNGINHIAPYFKSGNKIKYLIKEADHVITSSPFLTTDCLKLRSKNKCTYITSSVDTDRFIPINSYENNKKLTIGWTGTFTSKKYLDLLRPVLLKLSANYDFTLRVIGNFDYTLPGLDLEVIQWTVENEVADLQGIDIGIYPLALDDWVSGKSGLKAIQYMAFGLPTVATKVGMSELIIDHNEDGILVRTDEEWLDALSMLLRNPQLRKKLGVAARKKVLERYSIKSVQLDYLDVLLNNT